MVLRIFRHYHNITVFIVNRLRIQTEILMCCSEKSAGKQKNSANNIWNIFSYGGWDHGFNPVSELRKRRKQ